MKSSLYDKVRHREKAHERLRRRIQADPVAAEAEIRTFKLATIKLQFWLAAAGPAMAREAAELKASLEAGLDEMTEGIRKIEAALALRDVVPFRLNDECRWNGERIVAITPESGCTLLVNAPRRARCNAIDSLVALDVENLPRRAATR